MVTASPRLADCLSTVLEGVTRRGRIRQAVMAVESCDHSFRWAGATGTYPDSTPLPDDAPFFIASIDKLLNATVALKLWEEGRLDLDAPYGAYLPHRVARGLHKLKGIDYSDQVTVRHLLGHTSGLADWLEDRPKGGRSFFDRVVTDGDVAVTVEDIASVVRDELRPHFPPQDLSVTRPRVRYSDTNYVLLCAVIEAVTSEELPHVHDRVLIRPLGLRHTYFAGRTAAMATTPSPPTLRAYGEPLHVPLLIRSVWGIYSTTQDLVVFMRHLVKGDVFSRPTTLALMQGRWNRFGWPLDRAALRAPGWPIEYGLGLMRFRLPRLLSPLHPMPAVVGHTGSTGCWLFHCPARALILVGSVDEVTAGALPYRVIPRLLSALRV
jgi:D-alanyl-D-alanine carboxypeptidase